MRKRDYIALGSACLIDALLMAFLVSGTYVTVLSLLQSPQDTAGRVFTLLSLLGLIAGILFCGATFFWMIKQRYRNAATCQRFLLVSLVCQCVIAFGTLLQPSQGGVSGYLAAIGTVVLVGGTSIVILPWLILRTMAARYSA